MVGQLFLRQGYWGTYSTLVAKATENRNYFQTILHKYLIPSIAPVAYYAIKVLLFSRELATVTVSLSNVLARIKAFTIGGTTRSDPVKVLEHYSLYLSNT